MHESAGTRGRKPLFAIAIALAMALASGSTASAQIPTQPLGHHPCVQGKAGPFRCHKIDLMSFLPSSHLGDGPSSIYGGPGAADWGWTDPLNGKEGVIFGR